MHSGASLDITTAFSSLEGCEEVPPLRQWCSSANAVRYLQIYPNTSVGGPWSRCAMQKCLPGSVLIKHADANMQVLHAIQWAGLC